MKVFLMTIVICVSKRIQGRPKEICDNNSTFTSDSTSTQMTPLVKLHCPPHLQVGDHAQLICHVSRAAQVSITWYKDHRSRVVPDKYIDMLTCQRSLTIGSVEVYEAGRYTCQARNIYASANDSCVLKVAPAVNIMWMRDLVIDGVQIDHKVVLGTALNITCEVIHARGAWWQKNGLLLPHNVTHFMRRADNNARLILHIWFNRVQKNDEGNYTCLGYRAGLVRQKHFRLVTVAGVDAPVVFPGKSPSRNGCTDLSALETLVFCGAVLAFAQQTFGTLSPK
ncbi:hemicentin-1 [Nematostella vectensis]|uniref:hemicentin-1 n=1 Tax=Nematostella vectensis TaxID=45351 RepID=UPI0020771873|nr:hemicentin-1 [Nematostella vectensis]